MGYCVSVDSNNFSFNRSNQIDMIKSIKNAIKNKVIIEERWINFNRILKENTIEGIFDELRFGIDLQDDCETYKIEFFGEKFGGYEKSFFEVIAPYVNSGYIEYIGEDGDKWRYIFKNGECKEVYPRLIWE